MPFPATARQLRVYRYIVGYIAAKGYAPSYREISRGGGIKGLGGTQETLNDLQRGGWLLRLTNRNRAIEPLVPISIPRAPDGEPLYFIAAPAVSVSRSFHASKSR